MFVGSFSFLVVAPTDAGVGMESHSFWLLFFSDPVVAPTDAGSVESIIRHRELRSPCFLDEKILFGRPAWGFLLLFWT